MKKVAFSLILLSLLAFTFASRKALVISNDRYGVSELHYPNADAALVSATLRELGFQVIHETNLDHKSFQDVFNRFVSTITSLDETILYYSGHCAQVDGETYLLPVGFEYKDADDVRYFSVPLARLDKELAKAKVNIIILDVCRRNSFATSSAPRIGLAESKPVRKNSFVMYSAAADAIAIDGGGTNSIFCSILCRNMISAGLSLNEMAAKIVKDVGIATDGAQNPWYHSSMEMGFMLNDGSYAVSTQIPETTDYSTNQTINNTKDLNKSNSKTPKDVSGTYSGLEFYSKRNDSDFKLTNYLNAFSTNEFMVTATHDNDIRFQFASSNFARVKLGYFGIESESKVIKAIDKVLIFGEDKYRTNDYYLTQMSFGAGLPDREKLRLFFSINRNTYKRTRTLDYPLWLQRYWATSFQDYTLSFAKAVKSTTQRLDVGGSFLFNPEETVDYFDFAPTGLTEANFTRYDTDWNPKWRFRSYLYVSDIISGYRMPNYLEGLAPANRPLIFVHEDAYLLGARLDAMRQDYTFFGDMNTYQSVNTNMVEFAALLHKNVGSVVGFDFDYVYNETKDYNHNSVVKTTKLSADMRLNLVGLRYAHLTAVVDYAYRKSEIGFNILHIDELNGAVYLVSNINKYISLAAYGQYNTLWNVTEAFFDLEPVNFHAGTSLGIRF
ncbi:MAG: caspase family protein [Candidatus Cloacimonadaceae bacterium]|nr:caspase family protein [Candidatus Cloacimonadaceae bacterium]